MAGEFPFAFLKAYVGRRYALRGMAGFLLALGYAQFRVARVAKIYAMGRQDATLRALLSITEP